MGLKREEDEGWDAAGRIQRGNQPEKTSTHAAINRPQVPLLDSFKPQNSPVCWGWCGRFWLRSFSLQMTWNSTMSSGYSSLEEDSEEFFFTARTSFFRKPLGKVTEVTVKSHKVHASENKSVCDRQGSFIQQQRGSDLRLTSCKMSIYSILLLQSNVLNPTANVFQFFPT